MVIIIASYAYLSLFGQSIVPSSIEKLHRLFIYRCLTSKVTAQKEIRFLRKGKQLFSNFDRKLLMKEYQQK